MFETDFDEFSVALDAVCSLLSRGAYVPSSTNTALFFRALARHDLVDVRAALDAHVSDPKRGRFVPVPADILAQIEGLAADDGRPGPEEAWACALRSSDEAKTIVWTAEMAEAWAIARGVFEIGDEVGARMAFKESYVRLVEEARRARRPAHWLSSLGFDQQQRDEALIAAAAAGRIAAPELVALPAPEQAFAALASNTAAPQGIREKLLALRDRLARRADEPSADSLARQRTVQLREVAALRAQSGAARCEGPHP